MARGLPNRCRRYIRSIALGASIQHSVRRERAMNQTPEQIAYRAKLWQEFVAKNQAVLVSSPEKFNEYCEKFRERWIAGKERIGAKIRIYGAVFGGSSPVGTFIVLAH